ncbi:MAG: DNA-directed polymerase subunit omega [Verrucomicrobiota bacterium]|jgi:DNA-directed RNA polymerase subunit omega
MFVRKGGRIALVWDAHNPNFFRGRRARTRIACNKSVDKRTHHSHSQNSFFMATLVPRITPVGLTATEPTIVQFPTEATSPVRSLRNMTTQLLQEAAQVIPNQQLLINVVSKRVRQLGLGHRPMVETGPRASLTDIALKEIIAGKLTYESLKDSADAA